MKKMFHFAGNEAKKKKKGNSVILNESLDKQCN